MNSVRTNVIIGAGPAGLTAADILSRNGLSVTVFEKNQIVGGISRTENHEGNHFDLGGHRFFTRIPEVQEFWQDVLGEEFLVRDRLSRIYFNGKFIDYPLKPLNALPALGLWESIKIISSYAYWRIFPHRKVTSFAQWVTNRFGKRLFEIFFKTYTEKVWGISTDELSADWAAQRIKNLSLTTAILNALNFGGKKVTSLIEQFHYPRLGPGMMWKAVKARVESHDGQVSCSTDVDRLNREGNRIVSASYNNGKSKGDIAVDHVISSMPLPELVLSLNPPPPREILEAARSLSYRDFLTVVLIVDHPDLFPDNWIYIHDPRVNVGRIQNFKNWSPHMVADSSQSSLGLEYFCQRDDEFWNLSNGELIEIAKQELRQIGLDKGANHSGGYVVRVPNAYPVYDSDYQTSVAQIREYLDQFENLQTIGRAGLHRYDNQDHAMMTGMYAAQNILDGGKRDVWAINTEQSYHEEKSADDGSISRGRNRG